MEAPPADSDECELAPDEKQLRAWRSGCLRELGLAFPDAEMLAEAGVSHHEIEELIGRGFTLAQAARMALP